MNATVRRLPRQDPHNAKGTHYVVESGGEEIGVLAKYPRQPWSASLLRSPRELGQFKTKNDAAQAVVAKFTPEEIVMMRFSRFAPGFQASLTALAEHCGKTLPEVAGWWLEYARACSGEGGQSTLLWEFVPVGTVGVYRGHVPLGMVLLEIDGAEWVIHPGATDMANRS